MTRKRSADPIDDLQDDDDPVVEEQDVVAPNAAPDPPSTPGMPVAAIAGPALTPPAPPSTPAAPVPSWLVPAPV
jgi:hypothetical protein